jgi:hypothetical protein
MMDYFSMLSLVIGSAMVCSRMALDLLVKRWEAGGERSWERRPVWVMPAGALILGTIGTSWYNLFATGISSAILITVIATVVLSRALRMLMDYPRFRTYVVKVLSIDPKRKERLTERTMVAGAALIIFGLLV